MRRNSLLSFLILFTMLAGCTDDGIHTSVIEPPQGDDQKGDDQKGDDQKGDDQKGDDQKGDDQKGDDQKGDDQKGDDQKGGDQKGDDQKGDDQKGDDQKGGDQKGDDQKGGANENPKHDPMEPPTPVVLPEDKSTWKDPEFYEVYGACAYSDPALDETFITIPSGSAYRQLTGKHSDIYSFELMKREVAIGSYNKCVEAGVCKPTWQHQEYDSPRVAVGNILEDDARTYCKWIGARLPTYTEWMYAASYSGKYEQERMFPWGNRMPDFCVTATWYESGWRCVNGKIMTGAEMYQASVVGCYPDGDSYLGLQDMGGNVLEWVYDRDNNVYTAVGGSTFMEIDYMVLYSKNLPNRTSYDSGDIGFRCARDLEQS